MFNGGWACRNFPAKGADMNKCQCGQEVNQKRKGKAKEDPPAKNPGKEKRPPVRMKRPAGAVFEPGSKVRHYYWPDWVVYWSYCVHL
eukprot:8777049-Heterocapsa_arctica.AAC.1